jgi:hypothetical protein
MPGRFARLALITTTETEPEKRGIPVSTSPRGRLVLWNSMVVPFRMASSIIAATSDPDQASN